jgi:hypothetical protein
MTNRYIYDTSNIPDRLIQGYPPSREEKRAEMRREAERLAEIVQEWNAPR